MSISNSQLQDKTAYIHIFAGLIKNPFLLNEYKVSINDFPEKFHQIVFSAIYNLFHGGATEITPVTIDGYLKDMPAQYQLFNTGNGLEYIDQCLEFGEPNNFIYNFHRVKKFTLLRMYNSLGLTDSVREIYNVDFKTIEQEKEQNRRFNDLTVKQIIDFFEGKLYAVKDDFATELDRGEGGHASENIDELIDKMLKEPSIGMPFSGSLYNAVTHGARKKKLFCVSSNSGGGKSRKGQSDLAYQCIPIIYSKQKERWVYTGNKENGLFISSELDWVEVVVPFMCYIAEVVEDEFKEGNITEEEQRRMRIAKRILERSGLYIEIMHDFDIDDLDQTVQKYVHKFNVEYVFFDYIHTTLKMFEYMARRGAKSLQEHQILRILSVHLKNMCNRYNIWMGTATQLNEKYKEDGNINLDQSAIQGSKSVADKFDFGAIQLRLTAKDEAVWEELKTDLGTKIPMGMKPTHTINIYKNRGVRWVFVRLWIHFDMGTLRVTDLFATDYQNRVIDIKKKKFLLQEEVELDEKIFDNLDELTNEEIANIVGKVLKENASELDSDQYEFEEVPVSPQEVAFLKKEVLETFADTIEGEDVLPAVFYEEMEKIDTPKVTFGDNKYW